MPELRHSKYGMGETKNAYNIIGWKTGREET
jgi:hypothetical protein